MNKAPVTFLAVMLALSLTACGGGKAAKPSEAASSGGSHAEASSSSKAIPAVENTVELSLDKKVYEKEERIEVTLNFDKLNKSSAVIAIVSAGMEHGNETPSHDNSEEYRYLSDFSELPFYLWAPKQNGLYDVRVYADSDGGKELASVTIAVGSAAVFQNAPTPPKDGGSIKKAFFDPPKAIYMDVCESGSKTQGGTFSFALLNGNYSYTLNSDGVFFHTSAETKTHYCPYGDGWRIDNSDGFGYGEVLDEDLIYEMTAYLDTFFHDAQNSGYYNNISKYYAGTETVCYRECLIYEIQDDGFGIYKKFWIDPENGATLKYIEREGAETTYGFEVTQYNLLGPVWTDTLRPEPYNAVKESLY